MFRLIVSSLLFMLPITLMAGGKLPPAENVYFSILAGGGGTRLWPLSRDSKPKQFLDLGDSNLIEQSIARLESYPGFESTKLVLATASNLKAPMHALVTGLSLKNEVSIIADPSRRDTGPAILLNILEVLKKNPHATIAFLPADPYIPPAQSKDFAEALKRAIAFVEEQPGKIVLLGKTPTFPATGYGYIETSALIEKDIVAVASFKEKPDLKQAEEFIAQKKYLWNMGIFVGKAQFFAELFERYAPAIYGPVSKYMHSRKDTDYNQAAQVSVDIAIMQPASKDLHLAVTPVTFDWQDVGDVKTFMEIHNAYLESTHKMPLVYEHKPDASNNLVFAPQGKLVSLVGVKGLCVVDTADALLVIPCDQAQKVKNVVEVLKADKNLKRFVE